MRFRVTVRATNGYVWPASHRGRQQRSGAAHGRAAAAEGVARTSPVTRRSAEDLPRDEELRPDRRRQRIGHVRQRHLRYALGQRRAQPGVPQPSRQRLRGDPARLARHCRTAATAVHRPGGAGQSLVVGHRLRRVARLDAARRRPCRSRARRRLGAGAHQHRLAADRGAGGQFRGNGAGRTLLRAGARRLGVRRRAGVERIVLDVPSGCGMPTAPGTLVFSRVARTVSLPGGRRRAPRPTWWRPATLPGRSTPQSSMSARRARLAARCRPPPITCGSGAGTAADSWGRRATRSWSWFLTGAGG